MATKRRKRKTSPTFGPVKFGAAFRRCLTDRNLLVQSEPHQTFPWLVAMLERLLEGQTLGVEFKGVSIRTQNKLGKMSQEVLQTLYSLGKREKLTIRPENLEPCVQSLIPALHIRPLFKLALHKQCLVYLNQTLPSDAGRISPVVRPVEKRAPNRKQDELPDPERPAWANVNRRAPKKVQVPCRVEIQIKERIKDAAKKRGVSQTAWLEKVIITALLDQGFETHWVRPYGTRNAIPVRGRRTPRKGLPEPGQSANASANRADKSTTVRISKSLADAVDAARPRDQDRSRWLNLAIQSFFEWGEGLPQRDVSGEPLTVVYSVRFDREYFAELERILSRSGLRSSDFFRRVMRWRLEKLKESYPYL